MKHNERLVELLVKESTRDIVKIVKGKMTYDEFILSILDHHSNRFILANEMVKNNFSDSKILKFFSKLPNFNEQICRNQIEVLRSKK